MILLYLYSLINKSEIDNKFKLNLRANNDEINLFGLNSVVFDSKDNIDFRYFGFECLFYLIWIRLYFSNDKIYQELELSILFRKMIRISLGIKYV